MSEVNQTVTPVEEGTIVEIQKPKATKREKVIGGVCTAIGMAIGAGVMAIVNHFCGSDDPINPVEKND